MKSRSILLGLVFIIGFLFSPGLAGAQKECPDDPTACSAVQQAILSGQVSLAQLQQWLRAGQVSPVQVQQWLQSGQIGSEPAEQGRQVAQASPEQVQQWLKYGQVSPTQLQQWLQSGQINQEQVQQWLQTGQVSLAQIQQWLQAGQISPAEVQQWLQSGQVRPSQLQQGLQAGQVTPEQIQQWLQAGQVNPAQIQQGLQSGQISQEQVQQWLQAGQVNPAQIQQGLQPEQFSPTLAALAGQIDLGTITPAEIEAGKKMLKTQTAKEHALAETFGMEPTEQEQVKDQLIEAQEPSEEISSTLQNLFTRVFGRQLPDLDLFGHALFSSAPLTFAPIDKIPVSNDYVVGPGDVIDVLMWGRMDASYSLEIDSEGVINFPKLGPLTVAGLSYAEVKDLIKHEAEAMTGVNVSVSMGRLRTIQVFVLGEVKRPGLQTVSSLATAVNALLSSGGPTELGSLRNVQLKRHGEIIITLDLYDLLLKGDITKDSRLMPGDVIFVPQVGPLVAVSGNVIRPAVYEVKDSRNLRAILDLAGGLAARAYSQRIQIQRAAANQLEVIVDIPAEKVEEYKDVALQDGDVIKVFPIISKLANVVYLYGNVLRPGEYAYKEGLRLRDLIPDIESLALDTYFGYAVIKRYHLEDMSTELLPFDLGELLSKNLDNQNIPLMPLDEIYIFNKWQLEDKPVAILKGEVRKPGIYTAHNMKVKDLIQQGGNLTDYAYLGKGEIVRTDTDQVKHTLYFDLGRAMAEDPEHNLAIEDEDVVTIHSIWEERWMESVSIEGEIKQPGEYRLTEKMRVSDLIFKAGNFTRDASMEEGHLFRTDWRTKEMKIYTFNVGKALAGDPEQNMLLQDLDQVLIHSIWETVEKHTVSIKGMVNKPGTFPYATNMTVRDLILVGGNVKERAYLNQGEIVRWQIVNGDKVETTVKQFNVEKALAGDPQENLALAPRDSVHIKGIQDWGETKQVTLEGELLFPGVYTIRKDERLSSVIQRAGGFTDLAYFRGVKFTRESVRILQQKRLDEMTDRLGREMAQAATSETAVAMSKEDLALEQEMVKAQQGLLARIKSLKANGRVVVKIVPGPGFVESTYDIILEDGDYIYIPPKPDTIAVAGEVYNPTTLIFEPDNPKVKHYLDLTGGPTDYAEEDQMYIVRADGTVISKSQGNSSTLWMSGFENNVLYPGDTLVVPPKLVHDKFRRDFSAWTSIIYQIAVSTGIVINQVFN